MSDTVREIEKPQPGQLDMATIQAELGAKAAEMLLLRDYATRLEAAFNQQAEVIAELRATVEAQRGKAAPKLAARDLAAVNGEH